LELNHQGILSEAQKDRMRARHKDDVRLTMTGLAAFGVIGLLGSGAAAWQEGIPLIEMWTGLVITLTMIGLVVALILFYNKARLQRTIKASQVELVHGELAFFSQREGSNTSTYYLSVGARRFSLTGNGFNAMTFSTKNRLNELVLPGQQATVYYTQPWEYVLSIELHPPPQTSAQDFV
jgi:hypothetical protein